ncbi:MerC mercury resistance protein [Rosistilla oblonga]|uniref:MerC domain-containing protein n=1 Tax=Rosistilla oblonga TaxID=2527990 RepID=UPI00118A42BB|nr:MerC domain-containing protein [Rosistilla oblonga]QDV12635.1 MerC mercury resistance protein [Rosistilla oblonga]
MSDQPYSLPVGLDQAAVPTTATSAWKDWIGIVASVACAIHCAAMPFVIAFLPALGLSFLADEAFHKWMALACFVIALAAFVPGWRKHRRLTPAVIAFMGITVITSAAFGMTGDCCASCETATAAATACTDACCSHCATDATQQANLVAANTTNANILNVPTWLIPWVTPLGGCLLVCGHLLNRRYGCRCGCCEIDN